MKTPVQFFVGEERFLKEKALDELKGSFAGGHSGGLDYKVFHAGESPLRDILDYVNTAPFLYTKRLVVVRQIERLPQSERPRLISYIKKPYENTCLVLDAKDDSLLKDESDARRYINIRRFDMLAWNEALSWIKSFVKASGKSIEDGAAETLLELKGTNLGGLANELEKVLTYAGERPKITFSDIEKMVGRSAMSSTFDLVWAIGANSAGKAMAITADLAASGKKTYEIIGLLCWHFKRLLRARTLSDRGESDYSVMNILRVNRANVKDFMRQVRAFDVRSIKSRLKILLDADVDIKNTRYDPDIILEITVARLCLGD